MCQRLGTPKTPANPFHAGAEFRGFHGSLICYGLPGCSAPCTDLTGFPAIGAFYFQASNGLVALPVAGYDYSIDWTPMLAGLSPAGMAASLAAPDPDEPDSSIRLLPRECDGEAPLGPGMKDTRRREAGVGQACHTRPCEAVLLAATPERSSPEVGRVMPEG